MVLPGPDCRSGEWTGETAGIRMGWIVGGRTRLECVQLFPDCLDSAHDNLTFDAEMHPRNQAFRAHLDVDVPVVDGRSEEHFQPLACRHPFVRKGAHRSEKGSIGTKEPAGTAPEFCFTLGVNTPKATARSLGPGPRSSLGRRPPPHRPPLDPDRGRRALRDPALSYARVTTPAEKSHGSNVFRGHGLASPRSRRLSPGPPLPRSFRKACGRAARSDGPEPLATSEKRSRGPT